MDKVAETTGPVCEFWTDPFSTGGVCGRQAVRALTVRRKSDGIKQEGPRCQEHDMLTNDMWEIVGSRAIGGAS